MTALLARPAADPLAPLRDALLARARAQAAALVAAADEEAARVETGARDEADRLLRAAREQGTADATAAMADVQARARRQARAAVLAARGAAYDALRVRSREAVTALVTDPRYPAARARLRARAAAALGPDAVVTERPDGDVVATSAGRQVVAGLATAADQVLDQLGAEVETLWAP